LSVSAIAKTILRDCEQVLRVSYEATALRTGDSEITLTFRWRSIPKVIVSAHFLHNQKCSIATNFFPLLN
jgi:hypothetical protein